MSDETTKKELQSVDTNTIPWGELYIDQLKVGVPVKELISDPDTGMSVMKIKYAAGFTNVWHRHNCAHGMYVLDGILKTHAGTFGPGSFVWFPEGMMMEHGATQDNDVTLLFITNKPFDIITPSKIRDSSSTAQDVLRGYPGDRQVGVGGVDGTLAHVAVAEMGAIGVVVNEPAAQIYLRRLNGLVEGFPQGGLEEPYELPQRAFYGLH